MAKQRDLWHSLVKWVASYNRGAFIGILLGGTIFAVASCDLLQPTTTSPVSGTKVTSSQLQAEATKHAAELEARFNQWEAEGKSLNAEYDAFAESVNSASADLEAKAERMDGILSTISTTLSTIPGIGPFGTIATTLLAGGLLYDNRRKNVLIKKRSTST